MKEPTSVEEELEIIVYKPALPLVRIPNVDKDGNPQLKFRSEADRLARLDKCITGVSEQCLEGARMGCSVEASKKCRVPWVLKLLGLKEDIWSERDACETEHVKVWE